MITPMESSIFYWFTPVPEYELQPAEPSPDDVSTTVCAEGAPPPAAPRLVLTGYRWVAHPVFLSSPNPMWDQEVQARLEKADKSALDRSREGRRPGEVPSDAEGADLTGKKP